MKRLYVQFLILPPVTPECLYWGIKFLYERYGLPIYVTENGMSCHDTISADGKVHDPDRIAFLDRYLGALWKAADEGADVRGYFQWTFLDNFEWDKGYTLDAPIQAFRRYRPLCRSLCKPWLPVYILRFSVLAAADHVAIWDGSTDVKEACMP